MTIVAVPIEKEATRWDVKAQDQKMYLRFFKNQYHVNSVRLGNANKSYSILGKLSELTDEQCKGLVEYFTVEGFGGGYKNYEHAKEVGEENFKKDYLLHGSPKQSLISKLKSEGKYCKWMTTAVEEGHDYNSLPDDFLILIKT